MGNPFESHFDVLLLEDSAEDRMVYKRQLSGIAGVSFDIDEALSVEQAKDKINAHNFDCYIVDYNLPDATGLDFVRHLRMSANGDGRDAAVVMITGQGNEDIVTEAFKLGAHEYITKRSIADEHFGRTILSAIERAKLTSELQHFREKLEQSNRDLSSFAHTAAHDLKSPLRRVVSYCEILQDDAVERLNEQDKNILERMAINAKRMQVLVDNLLSYSMIEYDGEEKENANLKELAEDVVNELEEQINEVAAKVTIKNLPQAKIYPVRMRQLLCNLICNALKYRGDKPPHIIIDAKHNGEEITVSVQDNGQGIPEDYQEEIFKDFRRLHANEEIEGTGLGLSICKKIAERHGGKVWVDSKPGKGSTFYFTIKNT